MGGQGRAGKGRVSLAAKPKAGDHSIPHSILVIQVHDASLTWPLLSPYPSAGSVPTFEAAVAAVERIRFFADEVRSRSKMHVTVGHTTGEAGQHTSTQ